MNNIKSVEELSIIIQQLKKANKKVVFTNGCFDILHAGHVDYLIKAKNAGDVLVVALNTDASVKRIKGENRPVVPENQRAFIMANLKPVDYVTFFDEETPHNVIAKLIPNVLIKGADWNLDNIVGKDIVEENGGEVKTIEFVTNQSTSQIIEKILETYKD
ncbi:MAG: D-glycero-beta-D-manno-heptose 1-phosphate adenylyltransferase [Melioribacteraceae bacterium]|nr:D-glycero-beta-D-manno-heptose 1-phosphate adenylyltransferase [Melioribacteraceae bacterium]MCF8264047.1 D-glycero-beta-D-manno-heptose 1-phosphate adenylyltransferase [Melioribacteraceae bacterium]MCF8431492.1 D-glycero-beta-D-manno-heptose 1-phosphate adenylyltransferase [Melioribacteraceae bacterium]